MKVGIPKERRPYEYRAGLSPAGVGLLTAAGHTCYVEAGAGVGAGFPDEDYARAGARIVWSTEEAYGRADLVLKVSRPTATELLWMRPGQTLMGYLHMAVSHPSKIETLLERKVTAIAYEQIQLPDGSLPVHKPLSQIGGRMTAHLAGMLLQNDRAGRGVLLGGVPGVPPAEVAILGGGVAGENAAIAFLGAGAHVTILDKDLARLQQLDELLLRRVVTLLSHPFNIEKVCTYADVLVGAVLVPGERTPVVVTKAMISSMKPGSVFIDLSIDQGGCAETSRPTTHDEPAYVVGGVIHACIPNLAGTVGRAATHGFLNAAWPYIESVADRGVDEALRADAALARGLVTHQGKLVNLSPVRYEKKA